MVQPGWGYSAGGSTAAHAAFAASLASVSAILAVLASTSAHAPAASATFASTFAASAASAIASAHAPAASASFLAAAHAAIFLSIVILLAGLARCWPGRRLLRPAIRAQMEGHIDRLSAAPSARLPELTGFFGDGLHRGRLRGWGRLGMPESPLREQVPVWQLRLSLRAEILDGIRHALNVYHVYCLGDCHRAGAHLGNE